MSSVIDPQESGGFERPDFVETRPVVAPAPVTVTVLDSGESFRCCGSTSVLENLRRAGKRGIPVGCRAGGCGVCKVQVASGSYEQIRPMSRAFVSVEEEREGQVLACCIRPLSDLDVRVIGKLQKAFLQPCQSGLLLAGDDGKTG
jgi:ferredoxin